jgi:hypothetical protein
MTPAEVTKLEVGQYVHVRLKLHAIPADGLAVSLSARQTSGRDVFIRVCARNIVFAEALPLAVGDMVTWGNGANAYELVAIRTDYDDRKVAILWNPVLPNDRMFLDELRKANT